MKTELPQISKNPLLNKSVWIGVFVTILTYAGLGLIQLSNLSLGTGVISTTGFLTTLVVVLIVNLIYDHLVSNKHYYWAQDIIASFLIALLLPIILGFMGIASISTLSVWTAVGTFISVLILQYAGIWVAREMKL